MQQSLYGDFSYKLITTPAGILIGFIMGYRVTPSLKMAISR